jgi:DNA uptake protein ComE-like DNA-binding protein
MKYPLAALGIVLLGTLAGCTDSPRTQDQVRRDTAAATFTIKNNVKAAAQGIRDGLKRDATHDSVDINTASRADLEALPGVTHAMATGIIAHRPYSDPAELRKRQILPRDVYNQISGRLVTR